MLRTNFYEIYRNYYKILANNRMIQLSISSSILFEEEEEVTF